VSFTACIPFWPCNTFFAHVIFLLTAAAPREAQLGGSDSTNEPSNVVTPPQFSSLEDKISELRANISFINTFIVSDISIQQFSYIVCLRLIKSQLRLSSRNKNQSMFLFLFLLKSVLNQRNSNCWPKSDNLDPYCKAVRLASKLTLILGKLIRSLRSLRKRGRGGGAWKWENTVLSCLNAGYKRGNCQ